MVIPLQYNVALPPAILSRFDLVHVMIDDPDDLLDYNVARHIVAVHQKKDEALSPEFTTAELQRYVAHGRGLKPLVANSSLNFIPACCITSCNIIAGNRAVCSSYIWWCLDSFHKKQGRFLWRAMYS